MTLPIDTAQSIDRAKRRPVVFVSYNGLLDPLGKSQILSYLERLNREWRVFVISFEKREKLADKKSLDELTRQLRDQDLGWIRLRYHKRPSLPATTYDVLRGVIALKALIRREGIGLIHARGYVAMEIAVNASRSTPTLFDIRGLQPEEYVDGGSWKEGELKWRLAKRSEARFFRRASGAVVLTQAIRPYIQRRFAEYDRAPPMEVIPCCVDLERFTFDPGARDRWRARLGIADDVVVFVYSGSLGAWYLADAMAEYVRAFRDRTGRKTHLLWLVNNLEDLARSASERAGLRFGKEYSLTSTKPADIAGALSCADIGLALIKSCFSKKASSPTKYAEYLSVGLPIVITRGVGDGAAFAGDNVAVALDDEPPKSAIEASIPQLEQLLTQPRSFFRDVAEAQFDVNRVAIPMYRRIYNKLLAP